MSLPTSSSYSSIPSNTASKGCYGHLTKQAYSVLDGIEEKIKGHSNAVLNPSTATFLTNTVSMCAKSNANIMLQRSTDAGTEFRGSRKLFCIRDSDNVISVKMTQLKYDLYETVSFDFSWNGHIPKSVADLNLAVQRSLDSRQ